MQHLTIEPNQRPTALFGATHLLNANATLLGALGTALAGLVLGAAYVVTRDLWLAIGIHWSWNFVLGTLFGGTVSGRDAGPSLLQGAFTGPTPWTGGGFGIEAGLAAFLVTAAASAVMLVMAVRRCHVVTPQWLRRARG